MEVPSKFDDWLVAMDDRLDALFEELPEEVSAKLDYSTSSLSVLEKWLISSYSSLDEIMKKDKYLLDRLGTYVGETYRKVLGGIWTIDYSNKESVYYGLPVIKREGKPPEAPLTIVSAALGRKRGTYMQSVVENS